MNADGTQDDAADLRSRFEDVAPMILVDPEPVIRRGHRRRAVARAGAGMGAIAVVLAVVLMVRPGAGTSGPVADTPPPPEPTRSVAIQVVPGVVQPGDVVTAVLIASEENDLTFGVAAEVDRWDGDEWQRAGVTALCLVEWSCVGTVTGRLDGVEAIGLSAAPGQPGSATVLSTEGLADGWYRLVQRAALDDDLATGVFEVRTGARAAPPLPAQDELRLTVQPALVPPEGGLARVVTEVPPDAAGNLSAEDIQQVDAQLDPSALVQRWDGEEWLDVDEVPVLEREPDLGVEWGSPVVLPPLPEGSYRLVRTGPEGWEPWGVFTVSTGAPALEQPKVGPDATPAGAVPGRAPDVTGVVALAGTPSAPVLTEPSDPYFDQMSLLRGDPVLVDGSGRGVPYDQLRDGDAIEVWIDGGCAESFPVQCPVTALRVDR